MKICAIIMQSLERKVHLASLDIILIFFITTIFFINMRYVTIRFLLLEIIFDGHFFLLLTKYCVL